MVSLKGFDGDRKRVKKKDGLSEESKAILSRDYRFRGACSAKYPGGAVSYRSDV